MRMSSFTATEQSSKCEVRSPNRSANSHFGVRRSNFKTSRREFLKRGGGGFGALALAYLMGRDNLLGGVAPVATPNSNLLAPRVPHFPAKARSVIWLFMEGGPSH